MLTLNIIGAGKLGMGLGCLLIRHQEVQIQGVVNQSLASTKTSIQSLGEGSAFDSIRTLPNAALYLIATPDQTIAAAANALSDNPNIKPGSIIFHCSGAQSSQILLPLKEKGCFIASVHPMATFTNSANVIKNFSGTYCALEGDAAAVNALELLFFHIGGKPFCIESAKKPLYHVAGVFASNYLVTLSQVAVECLSLAGIKNGKDMIIKIMQQTLHNLTSTDNLIDALTGPIQRQDLHTIETHLNNLPAGLIKTLYQTLAKITVSQLQKPFEGFENLMKE